MEKKTAVSESVIRRLPRYYRFLGELINKGVERTSSSELALYMGITASQIRQDLNCFGGFGQQGYGYNTNELFYEIETILGINYIKPVILIGAGNLGVAVASYMNFSNRGYSLVGVFDNDAEKIGNTIKDIVVEDIEKLKEKCEELQPVVAILCIPKESAKDLVHNLVDLGIKGFLNFSHYDIAYDFKDVKVENVHISDSLMTLGFKMK